MRKLDLVGQIFGKLTVLSFAYKVGKHLYWNWLCECGRESTPTTSNLRRGKALSCGCVRDTKSLERCRQFTHTKFDAGASAFNILYYRYRQGALRRDIKFELTKGEFRELTQSLCWYCGALPSNVMTGKRCNGSYTYSGIDRVDSEKDYVSDNVVPCCKICNIAKNAMGEYEFYLWIERAYNWTKGRGQDGPYYKLHEEA